MMEMKKGEAAGVPRQAMSSPLRLLTTLYSLLTLISLRGPASSARDLAFLFSPPWVGGFV
jgi:hypothetical protein